MMLNGAANRDPRRFECPAEFRHGPREHLGAHGLWPRRALVPRWSAGPRRGPHQPRAHPRPHPQHPSVRGAPRPARRRAVPLRDDVGAARPVARCSSSSTTSSQARCRHEPRCGGDRRRVGHRPRASPSSSPPTGIASRSSTAPTPMSPRRRSRARSASSATCRIAPRSPPRSSACAASSVPSRSSSPRPASKRSSRRSKSRAESWDRVIGVNLTGTFSCVQAALADMVEAKWGRIVTIGSTSAPSRARRAWRTTRRRRAA